VTNVKANVVLRAPSLDTEDVSRSFFSSCLQVDHRVLLSARTLAKQGSPSGVSNRLWLVVALVLVLSTQVLAKETSERDAHIVLIRGLTSEVAVAKVPLPRGQRGVYIDSKGQLDQTKATTELRLNGTAVNPGSPVEITKVTFKGKEIMLELNHGGKSGKKWYQRIEVGMGGPTTQPMTLENQVLAYGSSISLEIPGKVESLTVPQVKQLLVSTLDFERHSPTVL
jgi:hypothetical protein